MKPTLVFFVLLANISFADVISTHQTLAEAEVAASAQLSDCVNVSITPQYRVDVTAGAVSVLPVRYLVECQDVVIPDPAPDPTPGAQTLSQYIFGHSLINHTLSNYGGNETSVPHWLSALSEAGGHTYSAAGRFGTVPQFANDEPFPQWGFDSVDSSWEEPTSFGDAGINNFLFTELNYTQWQGPLDNYYGDSTSPVGAAVSLISRLRQDYPSTPIYIYENWPDMWTFPLSQEQLSQYHNQTAGSWHEWWIEYHDYIRQQHSDVKMIPVGPVIAGLLQGPLSGIPQEDLYEDSAPHGTPTLYLLASMVTYSAIYREPIPSIALPGDISPEIGAQYNTIRNFIWNYLQAFTDSSGNSRVF